MLSKPEYGWSTLTIRDFTADVSDLEDIPFRWLKTALFGMKNYVPVTWHINEEGSDCHIVIFDFMVYIIADRDDITLCSYEIKSCEMIQELVDDMETYFEEWTMWDPYRPFEDNYSRRRVELRTLIEEVKDALQQYKQ